MSFQWSELPSTSPDRLASTNAARDILIRSYLPSDYPRAIRLHREGRLTGAPGPRGLGEDFGQIEEIYLKRPQDHFWIAEVHGEVMAMVGVREEEPQIAHVRRLRVDPSCDDLLRSELAHILIRKAAEHAREHELLKLVLHAPINDEEAAAFLHQLGFEFNRAKELDGRHLLEFYLNFYERIEPPPGRGSLH
jgi:N-acetylglutamate synthase-like GNAT family acetyltransferase